MPKSVAELKALTPVKIILPTSKYPYIMDLLDEIEYPCSNCSSAAGHTVFRKASESYLDPISGPGIYSTRLGVYCPDCKVQCQDHGPIFRGILDLLTVPAGYKAAKRAADARAGGIFGDDDQPLLVAGERVQAKEAEKVEKLPTPMDVPAAPNVDPGPGNELVFSPTKGWHIIKSHVEIVGDEGQARGPKKAPKVTKSPETQAAKAKKARLKAGKKVKGKVIPKR